MATIVADPQRCIAGGLCVMTAPELFDQSEEDGTVLVLEQPAPDQEELVRHAVSLCPGQALSLR